MPAPNRFSRRDRITRGAELQAVRQRGTRIRVSDLDARALLTARGSARVGVIVPKYKHNAVDRNRLKRRLKELARVRLLPALRATSGEHAAIRSAHEVVSADVVLRALPGAYFVTSDALATQIDRVAHTVRRYRSSAGEGPGTGPASSDPGGVS